VAEGGFGHVYISKGFDLCIWIYAESDSMADILTDRIQVMIWCRLG